MRVLFFNPTGVLGGAEKCLLDLLASLRSNRPGHESRVLLGDEGPLRGEIEALGVPCDVLPLPGRVARLGDAGLALDPGGRARRGRLLTHFPGAAVTAAVYLRRLRSHILGARPDVLHTNGMKAHVLGAWSAPRGMPVIWHLHDYSGSRPLMARLLRFSARPWVRGVAVSRSVADDAARVLGPGVPVDAIYNAVDLKLFRPGPGRGAWLEALAGLPPTGSDKTVRVGLVATYARWKGHEIFLDAVARLPADLPARFYIIGGPLYKAAGSQHDPAWLMRRARELGLNGRLGFVPYRSDSEEVFRALDVVVHASTRPEPFGRVIVEAMACGRALVATPVGGAAEIIEDGVSALACPPGDPGRLAEHLQRLINDPSLRRALGVAGRAAAEARFDRNRLADEWAKVYATARRVAAPAARVG